MMKRPTVNKTDPYSVHVSAAPDKDIDMKSFVRFLVLLAVIGLSAPAGAAAPVIDVTQHGAVPNDGLDDRAAFQSAIQAATASGASGVVYVPAGTFNLTRGPIGWAGPGSGLEAIWLRNLSDITIRGEGRKTVLKMLVPGGISQGDFYLIRLWTTNRFTLRDLVLDGDRANILQANEQTRLINTLDSTDIVIDNVIFQHANYQRERNELARVGDGIKLINDAARPVGDHVSITNSRFHDLGRCGICVQRNGGHYLFQNIWFTDIGNQAIDFEPSGPGPIDTVIDGIRIYGINKTMTGGITLALSGDRPEALTKKLTVTNSYIEGVVSMIFNDKVTFVNNRVKSTTTCIEGKRHTQNIIVSNNQFDCESRRGEPAIFFAQGADVTLNNAPGYLIISNNIVRTNGLGPAVWVEGGGANTGRFIIANNQFKNAAAADAHGIIVRSVQVPAEQLNSVLITGNVFDNFYIGIRLWAAVGPIEHVVVANNVLRPRTVTAGSTGVECISNTSPLPAPEFSGNNWGLVDNPENGCRQFITIANNGIGGSLPTDTTLPRQQRVDINCEDPDGCNFTPVETNARRGLETRICVASGVVRIPKVAQQVEVRGTITLNRFECAICEYGTVWDGGTTSAMWTCR
jgi:hypothetical protein